MKENLRTAIEQGEVELVDVIPVPAHGDRMVRVRTIEELLEEFDSESNDGSVQAYFVQVRPRAAATPTASSEINSVPKPSLDGIYLPNGKLNIGYLFRNADLLLSSGEATLARNIYKTVLQSGERTSVALAGIARTYEVEGRPEEARINYEESIAYHPALEIYRRLASLLNRQGKDALAADAYDRALHLRDLSVAVRAELHKACADCYAKARKSAEAERHYRKALELDPSADECQTDLGLLYAQDGKQSEAKRSFQDALSANPRNARALSGMGNCYLTESNLQAAHDSYARSLEIDIRNAAAIHGLVKCAYELKTYATAARLVEEYSQSAPVNLSLLYCLAGLQFHLGRVEEAARTARKILGAQPEHAGARDLLEMIERFTHGST